MMTPQEMREKSFEKAAFGGYVMGEVDDFLDAASTDYAAMQKENAVLRSKLKVLVDKIEEYRGSEDAIRRTLVTAQRTSDDLEREAREQGEAFIAEAKAVADAMIKDAADKVRAEENKLLDARRSSAQFIDKMRMICEKQLEFYDALSGLRKELEETSKPEEPSQEAEEIVRSIEDSVAKAVEEPAPEEISIEPEIEIGEQVEFEIDSRELTPAAEQTKPFPVTRSIPREEATPRPKFNFDNLRFGENYSIED